MKKRTIRKVSLITAILMLSLIVAACGNGGTTGAGGQADADQTWDVVINVTHAEPVSPNWLEAFREIEERSDGRFNVTVFWAQSLLTIPEIPRGVSTGEATFSNMPSPNYVDIMPLNTRILQLPFMGLTDPNQSAGIFMQLHQEFPEMQEELSQFNMMMIGTTTVGIYNLFVRDTNEIRLPSDLSGRVIVPYKLEWIQLLEDNSAGASFIPPGQIYENLERGIIDGYVNSWAFKGWFGLTDLVHQYVRIGEYGMHHEFQIIVLNKDHYNSLPEDLQQLWHDVFWNDHGPYRFWNDSFTLVQQQRAIKAADPAFLEVDLTEAERAIWREQLTATHRVTLDYINNVRGDTIADDIYNRALELIRERTYG